MGFENVAPGDPRLNDYGALREPELLHGRGLFIAEGRLVVRRAIDGGRYRLRSVLVSEAARRSLEPELARLAPDIPVYVCRASDFLDITGYNIHRGCLALVDRPAPLAADALLGAARTVVLLEGVTNADNVGAVFRNAAAFAAGAVLLTPACCDPLYRKAIRTSMAATLRVPYARIDDWPGALARVRSLGFQIVALTPREPAEDLERFVERGRPERLLLMVGTEGEGLSAAAEADADVRVRIPIDATVDSLNLGVAAGIALYRLALG